MAIDVCLRQVRMATAATAKADKAAKEKAAASAMPRIAKQPPAAAERMATAATAKADKAAKEEAAASAMAKIAKQPPAAAEPKTKPEAAPKVPIHSLFRGLQMMHLLDDDDNGSCRLSTAASRMVEQP